jgi:hypothetical protein
MDNEGAHPSTSSSSLSSSKGSSSSLRNSPLVMVRGKVSTRSVMESPLFQNDDGLLCTENPTSEKAVIVQRTQTVSPFSCICQFTEILCRFLLYTLRQGSSMHTLIF